MNSETVSIIIPVYNGEKYLERCLNAVLSQSYSNLEIILIDDGSTDLSKEICDSLAEKDNRVQVYHISNAGVSVARNYGLHHATGSFLQFVDSDDYVEQDMTECLVKKMKETSADCVVCGFIQETPYRKKRNVSTEKPRVYSNREYLCNILEDPFSFYYGVVWNKMYRNDIIDRYEMSFDSRQRLGEDFLFTLEYLKHINWVCVISKRPYHYNCLEQNSLSRYPRFTAEKRKMELENRIVIYQKLKECAEGMGQYDKCNTRINWYLCYFYLMQMNDIKSGCEWDNKAEVEGWKAYLKKEAYIKEAIAHIPRSMMQKKMFHLRWNTILGRAKRPVKKLIRIIKSRR